MKLATGGSALWVLLQASRADSMAYRAAASPFCRHEEDPFLLLESGIKAIDRILQLRRGLPLCRTWIEQPYVEEEVIPAIQQCLSRVDELDGRLLAQHEQLQRCRLEADREALAELRLQMA